MTKYLFTLTLGLARVSKKDKYDKYNKNTLTVILVFL